MNFQAESKKSGDEFEDRVYKDLVTRGFYPIERNFCFEAVGCEVDFRAHHKDRFEYVEAKGGNPGENKRPGAKRTDNVKKAIANGALIKTMNDLYYVVYFSARPEHGSYSEQMINTALKHKIIDEVRYLESIPEKTINDILKELKENEQLQELLDVLGSDYDEHGIPYWNKF